VLVVVAVAFFVEEPLRRRMERELDARLDGYTVRVGGLDLHPLAFALDLRDVTLAQEAAPEPPVAHVETLAASVQWRALLSGALVGDLVVERPTLHLTRSQAAREARDPVPVEERGWQAAVQAIYPLEINALRIAGGDVTYDAGDGRPPLRLTDLAVHATNVRNVRSGAGEYPSEVRAEATIARARVRVDGHADFLAVPHAAWKGRVEVADLPLRELAAMATEWSLDPREGALSLAADVEWTADATTVRAEHVNVRGAVVDYVHRAETAPAEARARRQVAEAARRAREPATTVAAERITVRGSTFGYVDRTATPSWRVFLVADEATLRDLSTRPGAGAAVLDLRGRFMGSGATTLRGRFQPAARSPTLDASLEIADTDMRALNDVLRAYGGFDVARGRFSLYSEVAVRDGQVDGYVKPLFRDLDVYEARQDREQGIGKRLYEGVVGGVADLLENAPRDEVATVTDLSGPLQNPNADLLEMVGRLVENAFFRAILPGLRGQDGG
jgi:hypothetical protein